MAQTIFQSFYILYPKSRSFLSEEVKLKLLDMLGHWTNGMRTFVIHSFLLALSDCEILDFFYFARICVLLI